MFFSKGPLEFVLEPFMGQIKRNACETWKKYKEEMEFA